MWPGRKRETRRANRPGIGIEALEGRAVPATFHAADVAQLQADIAAANNSPGPNTIVLAPHDYVLTSELQIRNADHLTILGSTNGSASPELSGWNLDRVVEVDGGTVTLDGVTISGGGNVVEGGGIYAQNANLTVANSTIAGNSAARTGGALFAQGGTLDVESTQIINNTVGGGGIGFGGGIAASDAQVTISHSSIGGNSAFGRGSTPQAAAVYLGGGLFAQGGTLTIANSSILNNTVFAATSGAVADTAGGGVATSDTIVSVTGSTIAKNTLSTIAQNITAQGSAFSTVGGSLTISNSKFSANTPAGLNQFSHPGATVLLKNPTVNGRKFIGSFTLGDNGFTPIG